MRIHELDSGVVFESPGSGRGAAGGSGLKVSVDTSRHTLRIRSRHAAERELGASRAGLRSALEHLLRLFSLHRPRSTRAPTEGTQHDLFVMETREAPDALMDAELEQILLAALRRSARRAAQREGTLTDAQLTRVEALVAAERPTPLVFSPAILGADFLMKDVLRFRPAAIAAACIEMLPESTEDPAPVAALSPRLGRWRALYSPDGTVSRALNKTLDDFSDRYDGTAQYAAADLWALRRVELIAPVKSPLHLAVIAERARSASAHLQEHTVLLQRAGEDDLLELIAMTTHALLLGELPFREQLHVFAELTAGAGTAPALRSDRHALFALVRGALAIERRKHRTRGLDIEARTSLPPIPLPSSPGIRFLGSVYEVILEGERMHHCIGTRALPAVRGDAFLFHVEHHGQHASIEVTRHGDVLEASGPMNQLNDACIEGERILAEWAQPMVRD